MTEIKTGISELWVLAKHLRDGLAAKDATIAELREALLTFQSYGCPVCNGDCASANPPVSACPMQIARAALEGSQ